MQSKLDRLHSELVVRGERIQRLLEQAKKPYVRRSDPNDQEKGLLIMDEVRKARVEMNEAREALEAAQAEFQERNTNLRLGYFPNEEKVQAAKGLFQEKKQAYKDWCLNAWSKGLIPRDEIPR